MRGLLAVMVLVVLLGASGPRNDYETTYRGQPFDVKYLEAGNIVCESGLADSTGYYTTPGGTVLKSVFKKQQERALWIITIRGHEATVSGDQGDAKRFQVTKRDQSGLILVNIEGNVSTQVITIDPQNSSFVYSTQNVHPLWNRANVYVGQCRLGGP